MYRRSLRSGEITGLVGGGAVVVVTAAGTTLSGREWTAGSVAVAGAVGTLLFLRQGLTLVENRRLTLDLERRVQERTAELEGSRRHFRDLVQRSSDVIAVMAADGSVSYCSPALTAVLGHRDEDVLGRSVVDFLHPEDRPRVASLAKGAGWVDGSTAISCRALHADGSWRSVEVTVGPLSAAAGDRGWVLNIRDVTERRLLEDAGQVEGAEVAERIVAALRQLPLPRQRSALSGASVGVCVAEPGSTDGEALLRDADIAMYQAKAAGRGRAAVFVPGMREELVRELAMESALRAALQSGRLSLAYQPIVDLDSGHVAALEALVRWQDAGGAPVPPALFIPLAEQVGLVGELDRWVLEASTRYVAGLADRCPELAGVTLNVNVSARDLDEPDALRVWTESALSASGLAARRLVLEITETAALPDLGHLVAPLQALRDRGVRISLDDFGTGYSSVANLRQLPLDEIKVDGSFVAGLPDGETATRVVEGIVGMARALRLPVVAEAVETVDQASLLRVLHCDYAQGWLFGAPMCADDLESWARARVAVG